MNYTLITALALSLSNPFNLGITTTTPTDLVRSDFDNVLVQDIPDIQDPIIHQATKTMSNTIISQETYGGDLIIPSGYSCNNAEFNDNRFCDYGVSFYPNSLTQEVEVKLTVFDSEPFDSRTEVLGYRTLLEIPLSSLNLNSSDELFRLISPTFNRDVYEQHIGSISTEVRIRLGDDSEFSTLKGYVLGGAVNFDVNEILLYLAEQPNSIQPETLQISIMPVDISNLTFDDIDAESLISNSIGPDIGNQGNHYLTGLIKIRNNFDSNAAKCSSPAPLQTGPNLMKFM